MLAKAGGAGSQFGTTILFALAIFAVLYFLIIRPQKKKEQQRRQLVEQTKKGDRVVTIGGIHGEVVSARERTLIILVDAECGTTLKMNRGAVHRVLSTDSDEEEE